MKKILALLFAVMMMATLFTSCEVADTLVVGYTLYEPMNYEDDNGNLVGFDTELAQAVGEKIGYTVNFQLIDWPQKYTELNAGNIDCIWNGFTITGREDKYTWSDAYVDNSQVIVVAADSGIKTLEDLAGK